MHFLTIQSTWIEKVELHEEGKGSSWFFHKPLILIHLYLCFSLLSNWLRMMWGCGYMGWSEVNASFKMRWDASLSLFLFRISTLVSFSFLGEEEKRENGIKNIINLMWIESKVKEGKVKLVATRKGIATWKILEMRRTSLCVCLYSTHEIIVIAITNFSLLSLSLSSEENFGNCDVDCG